MKKVDDQKGFTILELMIATTVFSVILVIATFGLLQVGRMFYKGITLSKTQETARAIMDEVAQNIQFSGGKVDQSSGDVSSLCLDNRRYSYMTGRMLSDNPVNDEISHALVVDNDSSDCAGDGPLPINDDAFTLSGSARELLQPGMRLSKFTVTEVPGGGGLYKITIRVVRGDNELLTTPTDDPSATCKSFGLSSEFCAASELSTTVLKRINVVE